MCLRYRSRNRSRYVEDKNIRKKIVEIVNKRIKAEFKPKELIRVDFGIIVGAHLGPAIGITFYDRQNY